MQFRGATRLGQGLASGTVLSLEGNIGVGKTTLLTLLRDQYGVRPLFEPIFESRNEDENLLKPYYENPARWALTFQSYAFIRRTAAYCNLRQQSDSTAPLTIMDRSVYGDCHCFARNLFEQGKMSVFEWDIYGKLFDWVTTYFQMRPDGIIYLKASASTCKRRIEQRGRVEERTIPQSYLEAIESRHDEWLLLNDCINDRLCGTEVLVLDGELNFEHDPKILKLFADRIVAFAERVHRRRTSVVKDQQSNTI